MSGSTVIEFRNLVKKFNGVKILDGINFSVKKGEIFCIVGPSGTGKSVLLKHIVRLLSPTAGSVFVGSDDLSEVSDKKLSAIRSKIGYLFQGGALLAWMTIEENVALVLKETTKLVERDISLKTKEVLKAVGLEDSLQKYPSEISGGMIKRAGLARAIVRDVDIILYDEPTSGLDPVTSQQIHNLIVKINRQRHLTTVIVTHDLKGALKFADRILLLKDAKAFPAMSPDEFINCKDADVQDFLSAID
jgi:phospholipid/cholesterol/gamma-HCH transport system ATP-binding protein